MSPNTRDYQTNRSSEISRGVRMRMVQVVLTLVIQAAVLFISSGRLNWGMAWALIGAGAAILALNSLLIVPRNPELIAERGKIKEDAKDWDKLIGSLIGVLGLITLIVAGLDKRFGWSPILALAVHVIGLVVYVLGNLLFSWAMASNKYFSGVVRIQEDRGHTVATGGPYQYVRHPGYVGYILFNLAIPFALGSLWALIPAGLIALGIIVRTGLEDKTLMEELDGYEGYAKKVTYRLLPGVW